MRRLRPFGKFLCCYLPGLGGAVLLGRLAGPSAPMLAPLVLVSVGFLAFAVAVSVAATPRTRRGASGEDGPVLAMLAIRRHRWRHAAGFALAGAAGGAVALRLSGDGLAAGLTVGLTAGLTVGHLILSVAVLFVAAWLIIGEAACSQEAIRRALLDEVERT
ncbi:hypothetical protein [Albidovulum sp.]|uniref:hypothetical protein n=1 Tax=Albidovulum sp. TaxID=1872424 RepID=UPI0039B98ED7